MCSFHGSELRLQHKVSKLKQSLAELTGIDGEHNILARQDRTIEQLQKDNRELNKSLRQLWLESEAKDSLNARFMGMLFGRRSEQNKAGSARGRSKSSDVTSGQGGRPQRMSVANGMITVILARWKNGAGLKVNVRCVADPMSATAMKNRSWSGSRSRPTAG